MGVLLPGLGLKKRARSLLGALSFVGVAVLVLLFISRYTERDPEGYYSFVRRRNALKDDLDNVRMKRIVLERRIRDHFLFFCLQGSIDTKVSQRYSSYSNYNVSTNDGYTYLSICRYIFIFTTCVMLIATVLKFCSESNALSVGSEGRVDAFFYGTLALFLAATVNGMVAIALVQKDPGPQSGKILNKLSNVLEKENKKYNRIARSVAVYNALSDQVKYDIRVSEYFSSVVRERILSGSLTEECARKVEKEMESEICNQERTALC